MKTPTVIRLFSFIAALAASVSVANASGPEIRTATDAVLYQAGSIDAFAEAQAATVVAISSAPTDLFTLPVPRYSFRTMAAIARLNATLFAVISPSASLYFLGRASAYSQLADLAGEP